MIVKLVQRYGQIRLGSALIKNYPGVVTMTPREDGLLIAPITEDDLLHPERYVAIVSKCYRVTLPIRFRRQYQFGDRVELRQLPDQTILVCPYPPPKGEH